MRGERRRTGLRFGHGAAAHLLLRCPASGDAEPPSSSGPGRRPFKAVTGIRTPLGAQRSLRRSVNLVLWCSLECTPPCQGGGRGFKSRQDRVGARTPHGRVAQSAEHAPEKRGVTGSTPVPATSEALVAVLRSARASSASRCSCHTRAISSRRCRLVSATSSRRWDVRTADIGTTSAASRRHESSLARSLAVARLIITACRSTAPLCQNPPEAQAHHTHRAEGDRSSRGSSLP